MSYGIQVTTLTGNLVLDTYYRGVKFLGRPTLVTTASTTVSGSYYTMNPYVYAYTAPVTEPPMVCFAVGADNVYFIADKLTYDTPNNRWLIEVYSFTGSNAWVVPEVLLFGYSSTLTGSYGVAGYDPSSALGVDLSGYPLWPREALNYTSNVNDVGTIAGSYTKLAVFASPGGGGTQDDGTFRYRARFAWRKSGTSFFRDRFNISKQATQINIALGDPTVNTVAALPIKALLFEATMLP